MSEELYAVLTFQAGYNTSIVLAGVIALGIGGGVIGVFSFLRKRALISDAISHATLPGIAIAFLIGIALGGTGRNLALLMAGAATTGVLGVLCVQWIRDYTRLPEDTAIGTVLSVFFGLGIVLLSHIQTLEAAGQAGLNSFLLGSTAALTAGEAQLIGGASLLTILIALLLLKEFGAVAFDEGFAAAQGWRIARLDLAMIGLLLAIVAIGLKTVGLVLIIALVIIPPASARFWTEKLGRLVALSGLFGGLAGWTGGSLSALLPDMPAGAVIVLAAATIFAFSLMFAPRRGVIGWAVRRLKMRLRAASVRGLLAMADGYLPPDGLSYQVIRLRGYIDGDARITESGRRAAAEMRRQDRLWQTYRTRHPDAALAFNPLSGLRIEDVLSADIIAALEGPAR
ncbi:MAG: metal ABC transporter permease [Rhodospirillaceae bacterium]|jgi:manganese/zinc/iron transport system permease protein|nr:metal ABC transporter permease [Rhodospirillaceae bacterium]